MRVAATALELRAQERAQGQAAVVMTMGALHRGHAELLAAARRTATATGTVIATIFVNPTQFGPTEDFDRYPRSLEQDLTVCEEAGVDLVFVPSVEEVYGVGGGLTSDSITVDPGSLGDVFEGASRRGHFRGVLTVVHKLLGMAGPDIAVFGEKDYQQLVLIRRMVRELSVPVEVLGVPTVRDADGLALSSRNRFLSPEERLAAATLPHALETVVATAPLGVEPALAAGREVVAATAGVALDYLEITDPELGPAPERGEARALIAARVGATRLIDNIPCWVGPR